MKRSEAIAILDEKRKRMSAGFDLTSTNIISVLESIGMLPPNIRYSATGEYDLAKNFPGLDDYDCSFEWEPEE